MGEVFTIDGKPGEYRFRIRNEYTGDTTEVEVAPFMRVLFAGSSVPPGSSSPCPFLRWDTMLAKSFCTVHLTRPDICREYQCWRILVLDESGRRVARVMDERYLCLDEEDIRETWEAFRENLDLLEREEWDDRVVRFFEGLGYTVKV